MYGTDEFQSDMWGTGLIRTNDWIFPPNEQSGRRLPFMKSPFCASRRRSPRRKIYTLPRRSQRTHFFHWLMLSLTVDFSAKGRSCLGASQFSLFLLCTDPVGSFSHSNRVFSRSVLSARFSRGKVRQDKVMRRQMLPSFLPYESSFVAVTFSRWRSGRNESSRGQNEDISALIFAWHVIHCGMLSCICMYMYVVKAGIGNGARYSDSIGRPFTSSTFPSLRRQAIGRELSE